jgi:RNA polymerase sigma-70 factor (ECF subfamily)
MPELAVQPAPLDQELISGIRSGDEGSMAQLYDRYSGIVYSVALRVLNDTGVAEDVLQEVFLQLWRSPSVFDSSRGSLGAWLAVIARHRAIDFLRKRKPDTDIADVVISVDCDLESEAGRKSSVAKIRGVMASMPAQQRTALEMAFFQEMSHAEIAAKTGEPLGTIKTRIRTALLYLRKEFAT